MLGQLRGVEALAAGTACLPLESIVRFEVKLKIESVLPMPFTQHPD